MNYVGKGILLNFLGKGNLNIASPMSANVASPTDLKMAVLGLFHS